MTAELINDYKDGELNLDVILHQPKAGETVEVKVLDAGKVIYNQKKTVSSPTDTLFSQQQIFRMHVPGMPKRPIPIHW